MTIGVEFATKNIIVQGSQDGSPGKTPTPAGGEQKYG